MDRVVAVVTLLFMFVLPVAVGVVLWNIKGPPILEESTPPEPVVIPVSEGLSSGRRPTTATLVWADRPALLALGGEGTVTATYPTSTPLINGAKVAEIDDHPVHLLVSDRPLFRALGPGDEGWDVAVLRRFLSSMGDGELADLTSETFDGDLSDAIGRGRREHGAAQPLRSGRRTGVHARPRRLCADDRCCARRVAG